VADQAAFSGKSASGSSASGTATATGTAVLEVEGLTTSYGPVRALDGVSLQAEAGRITAVLGANGAGKTTLLRTISGLVRPSAGRVLLGGEEVTRAPVEAMVTKGMAHVPEGRGVIAELTVEENLRVGSLFRGKVARSEFDRVYDLFPRLVERRNQPAHVLSGGERQMLVIGRALLARPRLLLLDEPSLGLAPRIVAQIFGLVRGLVDAEGLSVLLVEQNARSALSVADVGVVLNLGRVVATDSARSLLADEALRHAYLGF
jgi:branched-chain amino acid transport system ATP-binding protein